MCFFRFLRVIRADGFAVFVGFRFGCFFLGSGGRFLFCCRFFSRFINLRVFRDSAEIKLRAGYLFAVKCVETAVVLFTAVKRVGNADNVAVIRFYKAYGIFLAVAFIYAGLFRKDGDSLAVYIRINFKVLRSGGF